MFHQNYRHLSRTPFFKSKAPSFFDPSKLIKQKPATNKSKTEQDNWENAFQSLFKVPDDIQQAAKPDRAYPTRVQDNLKRVFREISANTAPKTRSERASQPETPESDEASSETTETKAIKTKFSDLRAKVLKDKEAEAMVKNDEPALISVAEKRIAENVKRMAANDRLSNDGGLLEAANFEGVIDGIEIKMATSDKRDRAVADILQDGSSLETVGSISEFGWRRRSKTSTQFGQIRQADRHDIDDVIFKHKTEGSQQQELKHSLRLPVNEPEKDRLIAHDIARHVTDRQLLQEIYQISDSESPELRKSSQASSIYDFSIDTDEAMRKVIEMRNSVGENSVETLNLHGSYSLTIHRPVDDSSKPLILAEFEPWQERKKVNLQQIRYTYKMPEQEREFFEAHKNVAMNHLMKLVVRHGRLPKNVLQYNRLTVVTQTVPVASGSNEFYQSANPKQSKSEQKERHVKLFKCLQVNNAETNACRWIYVPDHIAASQFNQRRNDFKVKEFRTKLKEMEFYEHDSTENRYASEFINLLAAVHRNHFTRLCYRRSKFTAIEQRQARENAQKWTGHRKSKNDDRKRNHATKYDKKSQKHPKHNS